VWVLLAPGCLVDIPEVENANLAGTWTLTIANRDNGCAFADWNADGANTLTADLTITQEQANVRATVEGLVWVIFALGLGSPNLDGTVDGQDLDLSLKSQTEVMGPKTCVYTLQVRAVAKVVRKDGVQVLQDGRITYSPFTFKDANPDCQPLMGCENLQVFSGLRKAVP
jgi:hypothetical protein